ncbi:MAG: ATP-binding protein [Bdellovibrionales bacterium]
MKKKAPLAVFVRRLLDGINVPLLIVEPLTLRVEYVNPAFEELSAYDGKIVHGKTLQKWFSPATQNKVTAICEVMSLEGRQKVEEHECELVRRSGRKLAVNMVASPLRVGKRNLLLLSVHDLSYIKKLQLQREMGLQEMSQVSKLADIGMLAAGVAHELNNPLMIVQGFAENLEALLNAPDLERDELKKHAQQIQTATERMGRIIRQMSRMVRSTEVDFTLVDLREVVQNVVQFLNHEIKHGHIEVKVELPKTAPVKCDHNKIEQVILNILNNAIHALQNRPEPRMIHIRCKASKWVDLEIWNNGPEIPAEIQDKIMTPFFTTKEVGKGTGLGLPVSLGIMKAHNGSLRFLSNKEHGTTFTLRLPAVAANKALLPNTGKMILLVNSDMNQLEAQADLAAQNGFQTLKASSGIEAFQWLQGPNQVRAVFVALNMTQMDGLTLIRHIRQVFNPGPVIYVLEEQALDAHVLRELRELGISGILKNSADLQPFVKTLGQLHKLPGGQVAV